MHLLRVFEKVQVAREASARASGGVLDAAHPALAPVLPVARLMSFPADAPRLDNLVDGVSPLVFPRLDPAFQDASCRPPPAHPLAAYRDALVDSIFWLHKHAGVMHGDLVPANVMWHETDGRITVRIVDFDAALPIGAPVPTDARHIVADNGFARVYHPQNFSPGATAAAEFDWWLLAMHLLGAPFNGGHRPLTAWLDGAAAEEAARVARGGSPTPGFVAPVPGTEVLMRSRVAALTETLSLCSDAAGAKGVIAAAFK